MKKLLLIICFSLSGCALFKPTPVVYHCPKIILPEDPISPVDNLTQNSKPGDVIKAWVVTAIEYKNWNRIVRKQVENSQK